MHNRSRLVCVLGGAVAGALLGVAGPAGAQDVMAQLRIPGPMQFVLGDDALSRPRDLPVEGYTRDGRRVYGFSGKGKVFDPRIASLEGLVLRPHARGITIVSLWSQGLTASIGVHVYQRVASLAALDSLVRIPRDQQLLAIPLTLAPGEQQRRQLPAGSWMLSMLPENDTLPDGVRLRVEGARCTPTLLNTPRRFGCTVSRSATVVVSRAPQRPASSTRPSPRPAYLLVRTLHDR